MPAHTAEGGRVMADEIPRIPAHLVGPIDQELSTARTNLRIHVGQVQSYLDRGDAPETVFLGFAQEMVREFGHPHVATMLAAAVLSLTERHASTEKMKDFYVAGQTKSFNLTGAMLLVHRPCGVVVDTISNELEPDFVKLLQLAELHVRKGCGP